VAAEEKREEAMSLTRALGALTMMSLVSLAGPVLAHGDAKHGKREVRAISKDEHAFGREGDAKKAKRTIRVDMSDKMRFAPAELTINRGDTVKFIVKNNGKLMHEMVIGTMKELKEHAEVMKKHPTMEHDEPYMAHVAPGKTETIVWQFTKAGEFHFGCLVPGHFEAGMVGRITVK
jgi:uncharacterized cupredoxin-like copper-binding protein